MKSITFIILLPFLLIIAACDGGGSGSGVGRVLDVADTLMFRAPDSAVALLDSLDLGSASRAERARHALLLTKALRKNHVTITDDPLITVATEYYRGRGDSLETQSLFYRGVILAHAGDHSDALLSLMQAADLAEASGDDFYLAMAYREQVAVYTRLFEFEQAARLGEKAVVAFNRSNHPLHAAWARVYIPQSLSYSGKHNEAYDSIKILEDDSLTNTDPYLHKNFLYIATNVSFDNHDLDQTERYFEAYINSGGAPPSKMLSQMSELYLSKGDIAKARQFYELAVGSRLDETDSIAAINVLSQIYEAEGDFEKAYRLFIAAQNCATASSNQIITHPYTSLLNDYFSSEANRQSSLREKAELKVWITVLIALILIGISIALIISYRVKLRRKAAERDALLNDIRRTESQVTLLLDKEKALSSEKSFSMAFLNSICEARNAMLSSEDALHRFGKNISEIIVSLADTENQSAMEELINITTDNLMTRFIEQVPGITPKERTVAIFVFLGFSNSSIAAIMQYKSTVNVRQIRHKIKGRILSNPSIDSSLFQSYFVPTLDK